jgi:hypothetical protein
MAIQTAADSITSNQGSPYGFKNRVINGGMAIDQRNAGASVTPTAGTYMVDRFQLDISQSSKYSFQRNGGSVTPPNGFRNYLGMTVASGYSITSSDYFQLMHKIEGSNIADLMWGTVNAKTVTLSFWVYTNLVGTFGGAIRNNDVTRSYPFTFSTTVSNTWTYISITIPGDTTGTWETGTSIGIQIAWGLGNGSNYTGPAFAWAGTNYQSATGTTSIVATTSNTFYLTGVQLEVGQQSTAFDYRSYGTELALCQRYFQKVTNAYLGLTFNGASLNYGGLPLKVTMRSAPGLDSGASYSVASGSAGTPAFQNAGTYNSTTADVVQLYNSASNWTSSTHCAVSAGFSSEL